MEKINEITINDEVVTKEKLQEVKEDLPNNERLTEVNPGEFRKLTRMNG